MASVALNRILIVLGFVGLFISGFLSLSHYMKLSLPCGATKGCDTVTSHASAYITGDHMSGGIPVAYVGLLGYIVLTILAVVKGIRNAEDSKPINLAGFLLSAVGALYSGYLTYTALYVIHATCLWCISSALTMVLTTVTYAALVQSDKPATEKKGKDAILVGALAVVLGVALGGMIAKQKAAGDYIDNGQVERANKLEMVGPTAHVYGNSDAPVTIVEFADLLCPTCQSTYPVLEDLVRNSNGRVRLVFHHFPLFQLQGHSQAVKAASIAEIAADDNKFWQFLGAIYSKTQADLQTDESIFEVAQSIGLNVEKVKKRLADPSDRAIMRVTDDMNLANQVKIQGTPAIFIQAKGGRFEAVSHQALEKKLNEEPYKSLITGGGAGK